jgi:hypothetical protein
MKNVSLATLFMLICLVASLNAAENLENNFEAKYQAWEKYLSRPEVIFQSRATTHFTCTEFKEIVALGLPVLPFIVKKMETDSTADLLWKAIEDITKVKIRGEYNVQKNKMVFPDFPNLKPNEDVYLYWWREGHKQTQTQFDKLYSEWIRLKQVNDSNSVKSYQKMTNLGIPVIPFIVEKLEDGDSSLVSAISCLTDGEISKDASSKECKNWWDKNREKWTIKFDDNRKK